MKFKTFTFVLCTTIAYGAYGIDTTDEIWIDSDYTRSNYEEAPAPPPEIEISDQIKSLRNDIEILQHTNLKLAQKLMQISEDLSKRIKTLEHSATEALLKDETFKNAQARDPITAPILKSTAKPPIQENVKPKIATQTEKSSTTEDEYLSAVRLAKKLLSQKTLDEDMQKLAIKKLKAFIKNNPNSDLLGGAYYWLGEISVSRRLYSDAAVDYLHGYKAAPKGSMAQDNLFKLAQVLITLGKLNESCTTIAKIEKEFKDMDPSVRRRVSELKKRAYCSDKS